MRTVTKNGVRQIINSSVHWRTIISKQLLGTHREIVVVVLGHVGVEHGVDAQQRRHVLAAPLQIRKVPASLELRERWSGED